jgi:hypothetical protein
MRMFMSLPVEVGEFRMLTHFNRKAFMRGMAGKDWGK